MKAQDAKNAKGGNELKGTCGDMRQKGQVQVLQTSSLRIIRFLTSVKMESSDS